MRERGREGERGRGRERETKSSHRSTVVTLEAHIQYVSYVYILCIHNYTFLHIKLCLALACVMVAV